MSLITTNKFDRQKMREARNKRERRAERNMRNEYMQGRGPDGLELMKDGTWSVLCCVCDKPFQWPAMASEYEDGDHYCGGSPRCCP